MDIQWGEIDLDTTEAAGKATPASAKSSPSGEDGDTLFDAAILSRYKRPLFLLGSGIRLAGVEQEWVDYIVGRNFPYVMTWNTLDYCSSGDQGYCGLLGINGTRDANLITRFCDALIVVGSHLSKQLTGDNLDKFAANADVFVFDVDDTEFYRFDDNSRYECYREDLRSKRLLAGLVSADLVSTQEWRDVVREVRGFRGAGLAEFVAQSIPEGSIDQYAVYDIINRAMLDDDVFVVDGGGNVLFSALQNIQVKSFDNRVITGAGIGCMGSGLPEAVGAANAASGRVICFIGDGSMMFNIQELQTIRHHHLNVVIVVFNNDGYLAIKNTEDAFFDQRFGVDDASGISTPDFQAVVAAFEIPFVRYDQRSQIASIADVLDKNAKDGGPLVIEVMISEETPLIPRGGFRTQSDGSMERRAIWDMFPDVDLSSIESNSNR